MELQIRRNRSIRATRLGSPLMKYLVPVLLTLGLISTSCDNNQREKAMPTQAPIPEAAPTPSAEEMLIDSQSAHIADLQKIIEGLEEDILILESAVEELESKNQDAGRLIDELVAESGEIGKLVEDLQSEGSEMEVMLNDLRCRSHIDIELVPDGCDWKPPDSMPREISGWIWSKYDDGNRLSITYAVDGEGANSLSHFSLRLYCIWNVNPQVYASIDLREALHEDGEDFVSVDYRIGDTERFEVPWRSWASSSHTSLSPDWEFNDMVFDDLRTGTGTFEVTITVDDEPPLQALFEIDGIAVVLEMLEPGCGGTRSALESDAA